MQDNTEKILEDLIIKAKELGITFKNGPATLETIYDNKIFHVLEEMSDDVFIELLTKKIEQFESKKFLSILQKHSLVDNTDYSVKSAVSDNMGTSPLTKWVTIKSDNGILFDNTVSDNWNLPPHNVITVKNDNGNEELISDKSSLPLTKQED